MPENVTQYMSERVPEKMSDRMPEYRSDRMSEKMLEYHRISTSEMMSVGGDHLK